MIKRLITYLIPIIMTAVNAVAQVNVSGKVVDAESNEPLTGASVIVKGADGKIKKFASTQATGDFALTMPNHIHMVLTVGTRYIASASSEDSNSQSSTYFGSLKQPKHGNICNDFHHNSRLASIIGTFKAAVTRMANRQLCNSSGGRDISRPYWQPRYHEHIILNERSFDNIMTYIDSNVEHWEDDCFNK